MIRLAIAEDHQALIDGMKLLFEYDDTMTIIGTANDGEALLKIIDEKQPDIVITDLRMPKMNGITLTKHIKKKYPKIKVIAFTMFEQEEAIEQMLDAGASGYILKNSSLEDLKKAIVSVSQGNTFYDPNIIIKERTKRPKTSLLTKRQAQILELIALGKTSREIANTLFIGVHTVDTHRKNMARILQLNGKGELMRYALDKKYKF
jgi:two-component system nitrate/nitrite response regulator NarL